MNLDWSAVTEDDSTMKEIAFVRIEYGKSLGKKYKLWELISVLKMGE